ncbi:MAG: polyhydroxyalkanoate synthesis repressor PhaR [Pseudomonadota bacterium]|nr:polyhydroxyalkanoate synthesis repressor PhaR [Pseudomonadota bacterium]
MSRTRASTARPQASTPGDASARGDARRVIKKYPNRRLYDTASSSYITLAQVRALVMAREAFVVRDAKSGEDLTRSILLQIILEEEAGGAPMFSEAVLEGIIRFYGHALQGFMGNYLEKNMQALVDIQARMAEQSKGFTPEMWMQFMHMQSPIMQGVLGNYLEQSKAMFLQMQDQMNKQTEQVWGALGVKKPSA